MLVVVAALLAAAGAACGASIAYRVQFVNGFGCHITQIDLADPTVKVTPILSLRFPGGAEPMMTMCAREQPVAAVTGTFFSKSTLLPVGDIVIDGRLAYFGGMGSALALTPTNRVVFRRVPYGRRQNWAPFESVLACGPTLVERGEVALAPRHEGFSDPHVLGRASRTAVGLTAHNKLLMVVTREQVSLWELARMTRALGCIDAINLDGGSSTGMYYRGSAIVRPARSLVSMLAVYDDVPSRMRVCQCELPAERTAIYRYRAAQAYEVYMRAQVPLAEGRWEDAVRLLDRARRLDHLNASYQARLAETLVRLDESEAASVAYARAAQILLDKARYEEALDRLQAALQLNPANRLAREALPATYRGLGQPRRAEAAERELVLSKLEQGVVAAHADVMEAMARGTFEMSGSQPPADLPGPALATPAGGRVFVDADLGVRLALPDCWSLVGCEDPSAIMAQHQFSAMLAHLRVVRVPEQVGLATLVELYWQGSFPRELQRRPVVCVTLTDAVSETETFSLSDGAYTHTVFRKRRGLLWVLSMTTKEELRGEVAEQFTRIAEGLSLF